MEGHAMKTASRVNITSPPTTITTPRLIGYVGISTLGDLLDASEATIRDWVKREYLPRPKRMPNGTLRWKWADIEKSLDGATIEAADDADPILRASRGC